MSASIIPAILPTSREDLEDKLVRLQDVTSHVQVDIVDGIFASPASWPSKEKKDPLTLRAFTPLEDLGSMHLEMDLIVINPEAHIAEWVDENATRFVIHIESTQNTAALLSNVQTKYGHDAQFAPELFSIGLAIGVDTDVILLEPHLGRIDYVQFMGITSIGKQGQIFDPRIIPKIRAFTKKHPNMPVQVDGGVTLENAPTLLSAGVSRLIVGSALWKTRDIKKTYQEFVDLTENYGAYV